MTPIRSIVAAVAAGILGAGGLAWAADAPAGEAAKLARLAEVGREFKELYNRSSGSLVRLEVIQSAASVLDTLGLKAEFDEWRKSVATAPAGAGGGGAGGGSRPSGRGAGGGGGNDRGGRGSGGRGGDNPPQFGGRGGGGFGGGGMANQVRAFLQFKIDNTNNQNEVARLRGVALRLDLNRGGFQGELSGLLLDNAGYILLPTGLIREAHSEPLKVIQTDSPEPVTAKFVGANLYSGYSILKLDKVPASLKPAALAPAAITPGDMLLSVPASQGAPQLVIASSRLAVPADDRSGAFLFDISGALAGMATGGNWPADRQIQQATRLSRELDSIIKTGKDIEQKSLGIAFEPMSKHVERDAQISKLMNNRRGVFVTRIEPNSLAATAGLKEGDVILSIDGRPLRNLVSGEGGRPTEELVQLQVDLATRNGQVAMGIIRNTPAGDQEQTLQMNLDAPPTKN